MKTQALYWLLLKFVVYVQATRLVSPYETDLSDEMTTEMPYNGPDPWTEVPCDFDTYTTCGWTDTHPIPDDLDWRHGYGRDSYKNRQGRKQKTGAKDDHSGGGGYMYISAGRFRNRTAMLATKPFKQTEPACLTFWYHMRGRHIGHLKLYDIVTTGSSSIDWRKEAEKQGPKWSIWGNQGSFWHKGVIPIPRIDSSRRRTLVFEAFDWDRGTFGNVLLDDISYDKLSGSSECTFMPDEAAPSQPEIITTKTTTSTAAVLTTEQSEETTLPPPTTAPRTSQVKMLPSTTPKLIPKTEPEKSQAEDYQSSSANTNGTRFTATDSAESASTPMIDMVHQTGHPDEGTDGGNFALRTTIDSPIEKQTPSPKSKGDITQYIYIAAGAAGAITVLVVALALYVRRKNRRRSSYYDNCTVHMTRMSPELADRLETPLQYYKLTSPID